MKKKAVKKCFVKYHFSEKTKFTRPTFRAWSRFLQTCVKY